MSAPRQTRGSRSAIHLSESSRWLLQRIAAEYGVPGLSPSVTLELILQEKAVELGIECSHPSLIPN